MYSIQCKQMDPKIIVPSYSIIRQFSSMGDSNSHSKIECTYPSGPRMHCRPTKQLDQQQAPIPLAMQLTKSPARAHQPSIHSYKFQTVIKDQIYKFNQQKVAFIKNKYLSWNAILSSPHEQVARICSNQNRWLDSGPHGTNIATTNQAAVYAANSHGIQSLNSRIPQTSKISRIVTVF